MRGGGGALGGLSAVRETTEVPLGRAARLGAIARVHGEVAHHGRTHSFVGVVNERTGRPTQKPQRDVKTLATRKPDG